LLVIVFFIKGVKLKTPSSDQEISRPEIADKLNLGQDPKLFHPVPEDFPENSQAAFLTSEEELKAVSLCIKAYHIAEDEASFR
jgi:hypothetical protein